MLDILTERGRETVTQEQEAARLFAARTGIEYLSTQKWKPAGVDAVLRKNGQIVGVAEMKCRQMTSLDLFGPFDGEWLITYEKLRKVSVAAGLLSVPGVGLLYLVPDKTLLVARLCDPDGEYAVPIRLARTTTQATVNGGTASRVNAFVSMDTAKRYT